METNFKVKTDSGTIDCEVFKLSDYIKYNLARTSETSDLIKKWTKDILETNTTARNLPKHDSELVIINLLAKSLNDGDCFQDYVCECGEEYKVKIDTSKAYINYGNIDIKELYAFKNFKIMLKWPKIFEDDNIPLMIVNSIDSIFVGDDKISIHDLNDAELDDLYSSIEPSDMDKIKDILLKPVVQLAVPVKCPKCGKSHVHIISGFKEFIRIIQ